DEGFARIGTEIVEPGTGLGGGLTDTAARDLGLAAGTPVGASLIDAHAGGVGTLGGQWLDGKAEVRNRLAYIFGTSACSMASSEGAVFVDGVWGPYYSAMVPGLWLTEGGQSAAGAAIDHLVTMHPAAGEARTRAEEAGVSPVAWLDQRAMKASGKASDAVKLAQSIQVVPEFLGNRSPYADPDARAVISGLGLETGIDDLVALYVAGLCGIGYGLRQLLERLTHDGIACDLIIASGGAAQSGLVRQLLADTTGRPVAVADTQEPVLLGAAMLGATAGGYYGSLVEAMAAMSRLAKRFEPADGAIRALHERRYEAFELLQSADRGIRALMAS
ncbi:MAG: ribulokinase, partial [Rhizobium sp.]